MAAVATAIRIRVGVAVKRIAGLCFAMLIATLAMAQVGTAGGSENQEVETDMSTIFDVGLMVKGSFQSLGSIAFDKDNVGALTVTAKGEEADKLKKAWAEVAAQDMLSVRRNKRVKKADGSTVMNFIGVNVERSSADYPQASIDYLSNKFGYFGKPGG